MFLVKALPKKFIIKVESRAGIFGSGSGLSLKTNLVRMQSIQINGRLFSAISVPIKNNRLYVVTLIGCGLYELAATTLLLSFCLLIVTQQSPAQSRQT